MEIKKIKTQEDYNVAIARLELIGDKEDFEDNVDLITEFELIATLISVYEKENYQLEPGHPLEIIKLKMNSLGIIQKDLIPLIGSSGVVSEVFNKKRGLSKAMIRNFSKLLHIDQDILNTKYELENKIALRSAKQITKVKFGFMQAEQREMARAFGSRVRDNGSVFNIAC